MKTNPQIARFSWALYDLANTIFSMNIISLYFVLWLTVDKGCGEVYYSFVLSGSILLAGLLMPLLGEISDRLKKRIPFLIVLTLGCVSFTAMLGLVQKVYFALLLFALANLCYQLAGVVYNSLLIQVSTPRTLGKTSGLGVSLGYLGSILGLLLVKPFLDSGGRQATFIPTAVLFLLFATPSFIFIRDLPHPHIPRMEWQIKLSQFFRSLGQLREHSQLRRFLLSAFLCLNAVNTIIAYMGVYAHRVMHFHDAQIIHFFVVSILFAIVGAYAFGYLTDHQGSRNTLNLVIKLWLLTIFLAAIAKSPAMFWMVGPLAGICLGGTWVCARTMLIELVPREKLAQMFGLMGFVQMCSYILGTGVWGIITTWLFPQPSSFKYRIAIISVFAFMFAGYLSFQRVCNPRQLHSAQTSRVKEEGV